MQMLEKNKLGLPMGTLEVATGIGFTDSLRQQKELPLQASDAETDRILKEDALLVEKINGWGLSVKLPSSGYSEPSLLFTATPLASLNNRNFLIYDGPLSVQVEYWSHVVTTLMGLDGLTKQPEHPLYGSHAVIMGHHCRQRHTEGAPSARSIRLHHDHLLIVPDKLTGAPYDAEEFGLKAEKELMMEPVTDRSLLPYLISNFAYFIKDNFGVPLSIRRDKPHGYSFAVPSNAETLTEILQNHFGAYKAAMEASEYLERSELGLDVANSLKESIQMNAKKGRVVQPAFTLYLSPRTGSSLEVFISPMLTGIGGPERAGIKLARGPEKPARFSQEDRELILKDINQIIKR